MDEVPRLLLETHPLPTPRRAAHGEDAFLRWRLSAQCAGRVPRGAMPEPAALTPTPPLLRGAMTSERFLGRRLGEWRRRGRPSASAAPADPMREERRRARVAWGRRGRWRRALLAILVVVPSVAGRSRLSRHAARPGLAARRDRPRRLLRRPVRLDLPRLLDRAVRLRGAAARRRSLRDHARREASGPAARLRVAHGRGHAGVRRARRACLRRAASDARIARARGRRRCLRFLHPLRQRRSRHLRRRGGGLGGLAPRHCGRRGHLLPAAARSPEAQERQRRRLLPALRPSLPLHGRARRRQRDERRNPRAARPADGSPPARRRDPDRAPGRARSLAVRARPAVREPAVWPDVRRRHALLAARRQPLLGSQRDPARRALHEALRAAASLRQAAVRRRHPEPRLRRGGAARSGRLVDLARVRSARKLRGDARLAARGDAARQALVSGQPPASAAAVHRGPLVRPPGALPQRHLLLRLGRALARIPGGEHRRGGDVGLPRAGLLPRGADAVSDLAGLEARTRTRAVRGRVRGALSSEVPGGRPRAAPAARAPIMVARRRCCAACSSRASRRRCSRRSTWPSTAASCS